MANIHLQISRFSTVLFSFLLLGGAQSPLKETGTKVDPHILQGLSWRSIGPSVFGGRVTDIVGIPGDPNVIYVAHASAGLFKSTNGGTTFESIFDDGNTISIGAIALSPQNLDVIYVGTGEGNVRNSVSFGDGIYKTVDGGRTWKHLGLEATERFSRIVVNPLNPEIVFAAAMGHEWGPNKERGLYRSTDGGASWRNVLYVNETTGASDVCFDSKNPYIIYAGMYDYLRKPWHFRSGGSGSGLYRSSDGGETWIKLTDPALKNGLPGARLIGRIGLGVSPSNPQVVYALIEAEQEGRLWRSENRGFAWKMVNADKQINGRPFYFSNIRVDPRDENRVYSLAQALHLSIDGGKSFSIVSDWSKLYGDHHALWIDPTNPSRLLNGCDGGLSISNDRGATWEFVDSLPFAQAYHVGVDMAEPYNVLGGFQDQNVWRGPNERWNKVGVRDRDWSKISGGDGMYALPDPRDPNIVYSTSNSGAISRIDLSTGEERAIRPYEGSKASPYRFNWNTSIHISPTNPDVIYLGGNVLFKTADGGYSWEIISPDLTTNNPEKMKPSGGITPENSGAENHCTIISIAESPLDRKVIWAGTDDGNVQLTRDGGKTWTNVVNNIGGIPLNSWISAIEASRFEVATAYISVDQHRVDDFASYAYLTKDYGQTWVKISQGLRGYVHVVREDPKQPNLLYAGTELGIFASFDRGKNWTDLRLGLPPLPVPDLVVHPRDNDLVIATHARGFYILDDVSPLQGAAAAVTQKIALFKPMTATRYTAWSDAHDGIGDKVFVAKNKPRGALISYYLAEEGAPKGDVRLEMLDSNGKSIRTLQGSHHAGINRLTWDLCEGLPGYEKAGREGSSFLTLLEGPQVLPGEYRARLSAFGQIMEQPFKVRLDPRLKVSQEELAAQYQAVSRLVNMQLSLSEALSQIQSADRQMSEKEKLLSDPEVKKKTEIVVQELAVLRNQLRSRGGYIGPSNLDRKISSVLQQIRNCTARPTKAQSEQIEVIDQQLKEIQNKLKNLLQAGLE